MKMSTAIFCLFIPFLLLSQEKISSLKITNTKDQIFAIVKKSYYDTLSLKPNSKNTEALSDFFFHSKEFKNKISISVRLVATDNVYFMKKKIDFLPNTPFIYFFVKNGNLNIRRINGVQSWSYLLQEGEKFYKQ